MEVLDLRVPKRRLDDVTEATPQQKQSKKEDEPLDMSYSRPIYPPNENTPSTSRGLDNHFPVGSTPVNPFISPLYPLIKFDGTHPTPIEPNYKTQASQGCPDEMISPNRKCNGFYLPSSPSISLVPSAYGSSTHAPTFPIKLPRGLEEKLLEEGPAFPPKVFRGHPSIVFERLRKNKDYLLFRNKELTPFLKPPPRRNRKPSDQESNEGQGSEVEPIKEVPTDYAEKRKKNNEAAKKSRDRRRQYEDELAVAAMFLEKEHMALKVERQYLKKRARSLEGRVNSQRCIPSIGNIPHYKFLSPAMFRLPPAPNTYVSNQRFAF